MPTVFNLLTHPEADKLIAAQIAGEKASPVLLPVELPVKLFYLLNSNLSLSVIKRNRSYNDIEFRHDLVRTAPNQWHVIGELRARGSWGEIYNTPLKIILEEGQAYLLPTKDVLKIQYFVEEQSKERLQMIQTEIESLRKQRIHVYEPIYADLQDTQTPALCLIAFVMEDCGTALIDWLNASPSITFDERLAIAIGICAEVLRLHQTGILHQDLKIENFCCRRVNKTLVVTLIDFGCAIKEEDLSDTSPRYGTPTYMPPDRIHSTATDIYALAGVLLEVFGASNAISKKLEQYHKKHSWANPAVFSTPYEFQGFLKSISLPSDIDKYLIDDMRKLLQDMSHNDPKYRPPIEVIAKFFNTIASRRQCYRHCQTRVEPNLSSPLLLEYSNLEEEYKEFVKKYSLSLGFSLPASLLDIKKTPISVASVSSFLYAQYYFYLLLRPLLQRLAALPLLSHYKFAITYQNQLGYEDPFSDKILAEIEQLKEALSRVQIKIDCVIFSHTTLEAIQQEANYINALIHRLPEEFNKLAMVFIQLGMETQPLMLEDIFTSGVVINSAPHPMFKSLYQTRETLFKNLTDFLHSREGFHGVSTVQLNYRDSTSLNAAIKEISETKTFFETLLSAFKQIRDKILEINNNAIKEIKECFQENPSLIHTLPQLAKVGKIKVEQQKTVRKKFLSFFSSFKTPDSKTQALYQQFATFATQVPATNNELLERINTLLETIHSPSSDVNSTFPAFRLTP